MPTPLDVIQFVEQRTGHPLNDDEAITFGPRTREINGITLAWAMTPDVVQAAVEAGHNCIIHHEWLTFYSAFFGSRERHDLSWPANTGRLELLARHNLTAMRLHGSVDEICIFDATARQLKLGEPIGDDGSGIYCRKIFASPVPDFGSLINHVKKAMDMPLMRVSKDRLDRPVRRIGMPWGGMGLSINIAYLQGLIDAGVDTFIFGEADAASFRFAAESGVACIETSHEMSEELGLQEFGKMLQRQFSLPVNYIRVPPTWYIA